MTTPMDQALDRLLEEYPELGKGPRGDILDFLGSTSPLMSRQMGKIQARFFELVRSFEGQATTSVRSTGPASQFPNRAGLVTNDDVRKHVTGSGSYSIYHETGGYPEGTKAIVIRRHKTLKSARYDALQTQRAHGGYVTIDHKGMEAGEVGPSGASWLADDLNRARHSTRPVRVSPNRARFAKENAPYSRNGIWTSVNPPTPYSGLAIESRGKMYEALQGADGRVRYFVNNREVEKLPSTPLVKLLLREFATMEHLQRMPTLSPEEMERIRQNRPNRARPVPGVVRMSRGAPYGGVGTTTRYSGYARVKVSYDDRTNQYRAAVSVLAPGSKREHEYALRTRQVVGRPQAATGSVDSAAAFDDAARAALSFAMHEDKIDPSELSFDASDGIIVSRSPSGANRAGPRTPDRAVGSSYEVREVGRSGAPMDVDEYAWQVAERLVRVHGFAPDRAEGAVNEWAQYVRTAYSMALGASTAAKNVAHRAN